MLNDANDFIADGGDYVTASPVGNGQIVPAEYGDMTWDVSTLVVDARSKGITTLEILLRDQYVAISGVFTLFASKEHETTAFRPLLTIITSAPPSRAKGSSAGELLTAGVI
jgi:hypothetical protein